MARILNRTKAASSTVGTGAVSLGAAATPYQSWIQAGAIDGESYGYLIEEGSDWELGLGVYTSSGTTLTRSVTKSSIAGVIGTTLMTLAGAATVSAVERAEDDGQTTVWVAAGGETSKTMNLPAGFSDVEITVIGRTTGALAVNQCSMTFNGLSTAIYSVQRTYASGNVTPTGDNLLAQTALGGTAGANFGALAAATAPANVPGFFRLRIFGYGDTTFFKLLEFQNRQANSTTTDQSFLIVGHGSIDTTAALTSFTFTIVGGVNGFVAGSKIIVRGIP